jgi:phosphotransferase system IIA component
MLQIIKINKKDVKILGDNLNEFELSLVKKGYKHVDNEFVIRNKKEIVMKVFRKGKSTIRSTVLQ